ncbi:MAG: hypothetical protein JJU06_08745 [Ectothiorhodospiraceae bacterium]|nr:hypothetical protein [Ectothiorhodospiraceae bacterium]MCH8505487.1 hypothetical protein [Ectothiorhodospiraceae bacterium]
MLKRHLLQVVETVGRACTEMKGQPVSVMAKATVGAFMEAKFRDPEASRALAAEVEDNELVIRLTQCAQLALCEMLATASDVHSEQLAAVSYLVSTATIGAIQGLVTAQELPPKVEATRANLELMLSACPEATGTRRGLASD